MSCLDFIPEAFKIACRNYNTRMNQNIRPIVVGIACFALGAAATRYYDARRLAAPQTAQNVKPAEQPNKPEAPVVAIDFLHEPLWAYGFERPPLPDEKARQQAPPKRNLRPDQDPDEQTRPRHLEGSSVTYSLVDVRDGQNVIDWFPKDHPPMPNVIQHGPTSLGTSTRGCGSCHLPN